MDKVKICCDVSCPNRMECQTFQRALYFNSGRVKDYEIVECKNFNYFEK